MNTDIPEPIKQLLIDAVTDTLFFNEIAYVNQPFVVDVYHTYVSVPIRLANASAMKKALKSELKLDEQLRFNICAALNLPASADKGIIIRTQSTYLIIEIERDNPHLPTALDLEQDKEELYTIGFAGDAHLQYRLFGNKEEAGVACLGTTGSGKSNTIRLILALALERGVESHLIDYKGGDSFRDDLAEFCSSVVYEDDKALALLTRLHRTAENRNRGKESKDKRILVIVEEIYQASNEVKEMVAKIASICRSANMRLVIGSQRFGEEIPTQLKEMFRTRIVHKVVSKGESFQCTQIKGALAERLPGKGAVIVVTGDGQLTRAQIANADKEFLAPIVENIRRKRAPKKPRKTKPVKKIQQAPQKKTVRFVVKRLKETTKSKASFPPDWVFYFAREYFQTKQKAPSEYYLNQRRQEIEKQTGEAFKTISRPQTKLVCEFCELWQQM